MSYFRYFNANGYIMRISSIAIAEYCVKGDYDDLPTAKILPSPFNPIHAVKAGDFGKTLYENRTKWVKSVGGRDLVKNDAKLMAQAEIDKADCYVTFDADSHKLYDLLKEKKLVSFLFWDANNPLSSYTGEIPFPE